VLFCRCLFGVFRDKATHFHSVFQLPRNRWPWNCGPVKWPFKVIQALNDLERPINWATTKCIADALFLCVAELPCFYHDLYEHCSCVCPDITLRDFFSCRENHRFHWFNETCDFPYRLYRDLQDCKQDLDTSRDQDWSLKLVFTITSWLWGLKTFFCIICHPITR